MKIIDKIVEYAFKEGKGAFATMKRDPLWTHKLTLIKIPKPESQEKIVADTNGEAISYNRLNAGGLNMVTHGKFADIRYFHNVNIGKMEPVEGVADSGMSPCDRISINLLAYSKHMMAVKVQEEILRCQHAPVPERPYSAKM